MNYLYGFASAVFVYKKLYCKLAFTMIQTS
jgi:hypothetical protein